MKKIISLILCASLLCGALSGCGEVAAPSEKEGVIKYTAEGKETKLVPDETLSGELTVSFYGLLNREYFPTQIERAEDKFRELYPNVKLNMEYSDSTEIDYQEYSQKFTTSFMAGNGPDVFWLTDEMDSYKMALSGKIADMKDYFENDQSFNINDFNKTIFESGQYEGGQYIIPTSYGVPVLLTTAEIAEKIGYDKNKKYDFFETTDLLIKLAKENPLNLPAESIILNSMPTEYFPMKTGGMALNKSEKRVDTDERLKKACEKQKELLSLYSNDTDKYYAGSGSAVAPLTGQKTALWGFGVSSFMELIENVRRLDGAAVVMPYRDMNGKLQAYVNGETAVNNQCENKQAAYNFVKILISPEINSEYNSTYSAIYNRFVPVCNIAAENLINRCMQSDKFTNGDEVGGISQEFADSHMTLLKDIDGTFSDSPYENILLDAFDAYFNDKKTYDECINKAQEALGIYLSE